MLVATVVAAEPIAYTLDHLGPMARSPRGIAEMLCAIAGRDPLDPRTAHAATGDYLGALAEGPGPGRWPGALFVFFGAAQLVAGAVMFFAYNWRDLPDLAKIALPQVIKGTIPFFLGDMTVLILVIFWFSAFPHLDFGRWALNIAPDGTELPEGNGSFFPMGFTGVLASLPFAVWLFLAIEQLPLAAEESVDPKRDMPKGIILGMVTLIVSAFMIVLLNPSVAGVGAHKLGSSGEPLLDGFRAIFGDSGAVVLGLIAIVGLIASFHTILFAQGRQIYSLSRAGYFPTALSVTHATYKTPHVAMISGSIVGLGIMMIMWFALGGDAAGSLIGSVLLNMAVFGAMLSYIAQAVSFMLLRKNHSHIARPYVSPFGNLGAIVTIVIALATLFYQIQDPNFTKGVIWVVVWFGVAIIYFAAVGRRKLILSPEEEFAMEQQKKAAADR